MAPAAGAPGDLKLLLDEMHAAAAAVSLRAKGFDVVALTERSDWRGRFDVDVLEAATREHRAVVTENVADFALIARDWLGEGRPHAGLVFTSPVRFDRAKRAYPGNLVSALASFLTAPAPTGSGWVWWL